MLNEVAFEAFFIIETILLIKWLIRGGWKQ